MRAFFWGLTESLFHLGPLLVDRVGLRTSAEIQFKQKIKNHFTFKGYVHWSPSHASFGSSREKRCVTTHTTAAKENIRTFLLQVC